MVKCQVCAYENEDGAEYCEECGVRLGGAPAAQAQPVNSALGAGALAVAAQPAAEPEPPAPAAAAAAPAAAAATVPCITCHTALPVGSRFCPKCGSKQDAAPGGAAAASNKCPSCGVEADPGAAFCGNCGARMGAAAEPPPPPKPKGDVIRLRMVAGKDKDKLFEIEKGEVRIGRLGENDIPLEADGYVSGKHTRISKQGGEFFVEDLGSTNGTFLKVRKLTRLSPGDEIKVGQSIFRLE